jgi:hypothetical protein
MRKQYLHLSAYPCDGCGGPVVAGSLAVRENEISKATEIKEVGVICLSCGHRQGKMTAWCYPSFSAGGMGVSEPHRAAACYDSIRRNAQSRSLTVQHVTAGTEPVGDSYLTKAY